MSMVWIISLLLELMDSWHFNPGRAPVDGFGHGHVAVTGGTGLFPPQPLFYTLIQGQK